MPQYIDFGKTEYATKIAPIGWSKDGKVAFFTCKDEDLAAFYDYTIYIFNTVNDSILWADGYESSYEDGFQPNTRIHKSFQKYFFSETVQNRLKENNIIAASHFSMFPLTVTGSVYNCSAESIYSDTLKNIYDDYALIEYKIIVEKDSLDKAVAKKQKVIMSQKVDHTYLISVSISGAFVSPYEDRLLIVFNKNLRGPGGTNEVFGFSGVHLQYGFK